jgi:hypothetical protein
MKQINVHSKSPFGTSPLRDSAAGAIGVIVQFGGVGQTELHLLTRDFRSGVEGRGSERVLKQLSNNYLGVITNDYPTKLKDSYKCKSIN